MTKPAIYQRKDLVKPDKDATGLEAPFKASEVSVIVSGRQRLASASYILNQGPNSAWCRVLIFWSFITTLSSVFSIYYAIEAQGRLAEARGNNAAFILSGGSNDPAMVTSSNEPRYNDLAHRFASLFQKANAARRIKHRHRHGHNKHSYNKPSKPNNNYYPPKNSRRLSQQPTHFEADAIVRRTLAGAKNQALREINSFFDDSAMNNADESLVVVEIDGYASNNEPRILNLPQFIVDFHSLLHPLSEIIKESKTNLETNDKTMLLKDAPEFVQKWHDLMHTSAEYHHPKDVSLKFDLDKKANKITETISSGPGENVELIADNLKVVEGQQQINSNFNLEDPDFAYQDNFTPESEDDEEHSLEDNALDHFQSDFESHHASDILPEGSHRQEKALNILKGVESIKFQDSRFVDHTYEDDNSDFSDYDESDEYSDEHDSVYDESDEYSDEGSDEYYYDDPSDESVSSKENADVSIDIGYDEAAKELYETFDDGIMVTSIKAKTLAELEQKELEMAKNLKDADRFFGDHHNRKKIELIEELYKLQQSEGASQFEESLGNFSNEETFREELENSIEEAIQFLEAESPEADTPNHFEYDESNASADSKMEMEDEYFNSVSYEYSDELPILEGGNRVGGFDERGFAQALNLLSQLTFEAKENGKDLAPHDQEHHYVEQADSDEHYHESVDEVKSSLEMMNAKVGRRPLILSDLDDLVNAWLAKNNQK